MVRAQEQRASVTATFDVNKSHPARRFSSENDIADEDEIILRRTLSADGRSRAYINDQPVSVGLMRQLGEQLLEVHGQFDDRGLMDRRTTGQRSTNSAGWAVWPTRRGPRLVCGR